MVYIKRVERNKRKYVTAVSGLEAHGMDLKKVAKEFGKKCEWLFLLFFYGFEDGYGCMGNWGWGIRRGWASLRADVWHSRDG